MSFPYDVLTVQEVILNETEYQESSIENPVKPDIWFFVLVRKWLFFKKWYATPVTRHANAVREHIANGGKSGELFPPFFSEGKSVDLCKGYFNKRLQTEILTACGVYILRKQEDKTRNVLDSLIKELSKSENKTE